MSRIMMRRKIIYKKLLVINMIITMLLGLFLRDSIHVLAAVDEQRPKNPIVTEDGTTWDTVYFGNYLQKDGVSMPIKWRVLSVNGDDAYLMTDGLFYANVRNGGDWDSTVESEVGGYTNWSDSEIRSWLNGYDETCNTWEKDYTNWNFLDTAFTKDEQAAIIVQTVDGVTDMVSSPSIADMTNKSYGFSEDMDTEDIGRVAQWVTVNVDNRLEDTDDYGQQPYGVPYCYYLRDVGLSDGLTRFYEVHGNGQDLGVITELSFWLSTPIGIRPVLHLDLSKDVWYMGSPVSSDQALLREDAVTKLGYYIYNGEAIIYGYSGEAQTLSIPDYLAGYPITYVECLEKRGSDGGWLVYNENKTISKLILPDSVWGIGALGCIALKEIQFGENISYIGASAFERSQLTQISIPNTVTYIGANAFQNADQLQTVVLSSGLSMITYGMFEDCNTLKSVVLPAGLTTIESFTFSSCDALGQLTIPSSVTKISMYAFDKYLQLVVEPGSAGETFAITNRVNYVAGEKVVIFQQRDDEEDDNNDDEDDENDDDDIGNENGTTQPPTTEQPTTLEQPTTTEQQDVPASTEQEDTAEVLPADVGTTFTDTKTKAKYKVTSASAVNPTVAYVKSTGSAASSVTIPASVIVNDITYKVTSIAASAFKNNKKLTKVTINKNVTMIGANAFSGCSKLKTVTLPSNSALTAIGEKAFYQCTTLTKITIPAKVKTIGKQVFYGCKKLKTVTIQTTKLTTKTVGAKAFSGIYAQATIKVPKSKLTAYKTLLKKKGITGKKQKIQK